MDWLKRVVKVEATTPVPLNIRRIFSKFGEIIDLYPCKTGIRGRAHIFIKFKDEHSAKRAINFELHIPDIHVYSLSDNPRLIEQFQVVNSPVSGPDASGIVSDSWNIPALPNFSRQSDSGGGKKSRPHWATKLSDQPTDPTAPPINTYIRTPASHASYLNALKSLQSRFSTPPTLARTSNPSRKATSKQQPISGVTSNTTSFTFSAPLAPRASTRAGLSTSTPPPLHTPGPNPSSISPNTQLLLCFQGEIITYDLKALDSDTRPIIELLRITDSERGNWMTVGAYYRRSGCTQAAMSVIQTMIEAMTGHGVSEDDLKPAFLFLSGCETDLAKQARAVHSTPEVAEHYTNAQKWLQKVYGSDKSPAAPQAGGVVKNILPSPPRQPEATVQATSRDTDVKTDNLNASAAGGLAQQKMFEREIQSLRERQHEQRTLLSETRVAKRKLEDDFDYERDLRYRLQRRLDDTRKELEMARKMEAYALDQVKREVEARRKAENMARVEKNQRVVLEAE